MGGNGAIGGDGVVSSDDSNLIHYRAKFSMFELRTFGASGGPSGCIPIIRGKGARTRGFGGWLWRWGRAFGLHWDQLPNPIGPGATILVGLYLGGITVQL